MQKTGRREGRGPDLEFFGVLPQVPEHERVFDGDRDLRAQHLQELELVVREDWEGVRGTGTSSGS